MYILCDPSEERLARIIKNGEAVTYPKLLFIKHRLNIERTIEKGLESSKIDIDSTTDAPPDLVSHIIENEEGMGVSDDDSIYMLGKGSNSDEKLKSSEFKGDNSQQNYKIADNVFSTDGEDDGDLEGDEHGDIDSKPNLGFLGIHMGFNPENVSEESYDEEHYDSHEEESDKGT